MFSLVTLTSHSLIKEKGNGANKQATFLAGFVPEVVENVDDINKMIVLKIKEEGNKTPD